jgi:hypothetical protein
MRNLGHSRRARSIPRYADQYEDDDNEDRMVMLPTRNRPLGPGRPLTARDGRTASSLTDDEHTQLYYIVQSLERHADCAMLHMKGSNIKSKNPSLIPVFSSIRTKSRRKRYKCLQDYIDHFNLLWDNLGSQSARLMRYFETLYSKSFSEPSFGHERQYSSNSSQENYHSHNL